MRDLLKFVYYFFRAAFGPREKETAWNYYMRTEGYKLYNHPKRNHDN